MSKAFLADSIRKHFARFATRIAFLPLFPIPYVESCAARMGRVYDFATTAFAIPDRIDTVGPKISNGSQQHCQLPGKPADDEEKRKLKVCAKCRAVSYCDRKCQVDDWQGIRRPATNELLAFFFFA